MTKIEALPPAIEEEAARLGLQPATDERRQDNGIGNQR